MKIKTLLVSFIAVLSFSATTVVLVSGHVSAVSPKDAVCDGAGLVSGATGCTPPAGSPDVDSTLKKGINLFSAIIGIITVVMMMIGGIKYTTSGGDSGKVASAQNTIMYAAIGLVIVVLAQVIVRFVLQRFTQ